MSKAKEFAIQQIFDDLGRFFGKQWERENKIDEPGVLTYWIEELDKLALTAQELTEGLKLLKKEWTSKYPPNFKDFAHFCTIGRNKKDEIEQKAFNLTQIQEDKLQERKFLKSKNRAEATHQEYWLKVDEIFENIPGNQETLRRAARSP